MHGTHRLACITLLTDHRIAQLTAQLFEYRGGEQKVTQGSWLAGEHLLEQEVEDVAIFPGDGVDECGRVGALLQGQRRQLEPGHPALRPRHETSDVRAG